MASVECKTQDEAAAVERGDMIVWRGGPLVVHGSAIVRAHGSADVYAYGSASVSAYDSASVRAYDSASVSAYGSASVSAYDSADVSAYDSASVRAYGSASVSAYDSASVRAYGSASVRAYDSASVYDAVTGSPLRRERPRIVIGLLGSRNAMLGVSLPSDGSEPVIYAGCWSGRLSEFATRVDTVYPDGQFGTEYRAAIAFIRAITEGRQ